MKFRFITLQIVVTAVFFFSGSAFAKTAGDSRWEVWPKIKGATAALRDRQLSVYADPKNPTHIVVYPTAWLIRRERNMVLLPNCVFKLSSGKLLLDTTCRNEKGFLPGVEWSDPKMGISWVSWIFRRPKFTETTISIWTGKEWLNIEGLPKLDDKR